MESVITNANLRFQLSDSAKEKIVTAICWLCMALFFYTAYAKIVDHARFYRGLTRVNLISGIAVYISYAVPAIEIVVALLLLIPQSTRIGLYSFIAVMSSFTTYIVSVMIWEKKLPCHCGGAIEKLTWGQHIWFNLALIFIAFVALRLIQLNTSFKNLRK